MAGLEDPSDDQGTSHLEPFAKGEWTKIPQETCSKLVNTYSNQLETVIKNKGYAIGS